MHFRQPEKWPSSREPRASQLPALGLVAPWPGSAAAWFEVWQARLHLAAFWMLCFQFLEHELESSGGSENTNRKV